MLYFLIDSVGRQASRYGELRVKDFLLMILAAIFMLGMPGWLYFVIRYLGKV